MNTTNIPMVESRSFQQVNEEHSGLNMTHDVTQPTETAVADDECYTNNCILYYATYAGAGIAIFGILLTLLSYIGYRKFRVKRTHIVMVNLCVCLLMYFTAFALSNRHRHTSVFTHSDSHELCIAGAFLCHFSVLCSWFWIAAYWVLLLVMFKRPLGGHINHFFIKAALPSYSIPFASALIAILVAYANGDTDGESHMYISERCFIDNAYLYIGLVVPFAIVVVPIGVIFCYVLRGLAGTGDSLREQRNKERVKGHLIKLSVITLFIALVIISTVILPAVENEDKVMKYISGICFTIAAIALGVLLMFFFCIHQADIRHHWVSVITGKTHSFNQRSMSKGKADAMATYGSRKSSTVNSRQPILYVENADETERKSSTIRIVPKDDADMSTLGLIQIPGTPSPSVEKRKSNIKAAEDCANSDSSNDKSGTNKEAIKNGEAKRSSRLFNKDISAKIKRESFHGASESKGKTLNGVKGSNAVESRLSSRANNKDIKRRSFSTSTIKPEPPIPRLGKRQSVLSTDSTQMTNFD